jgi:U3 small nucleolar RNA-associated protein 14
VTNDSSAAEKAQEKVRKQKSKISAARSSVEIDMNQTLNFVDTHGSDNDDDVGTPDGKVLFQQEDLVKKAFADDDVVAEFAGDKKRKIEEEGDQEIDVTLPGWGSWGGSDITAKKRYIKKVKGVNETARRDAKLKNVIINEKVNKKTQAFSVNSVPFPFETREQYERSLRMPIGREWSSRDTFQKLTKPRVIVKQGTVIDPLKAPFK